MRIKAQKLKSRKENKLKDKLFNKIVKENYNNNLEKVLSKKDFSEDIKNVLLSMFYKIETGFADYSTVKRETFDKKEYIEKLIKIIEKDCDKIEFVRKKETVLKTDATNENDENDKIATIQDEVASEKETITETTSKKVTGKKAAKAKTAKNETLEEPEAATEVSTTEPKVATATTDATAETEVIKEATAESEAVDETEVIEDVAEIEAEAEVATDEKEKSEPEQILSKNTIVCEPIDTKILSALVKIRKKGQTNKRDR